MWRSRLTKDTCNDLSYEAPRQRFPDVDASSLSFPLTTDVGALAQGQRSFEYEDYTIDNLHALLISRTSTCRNIIERYLDRIVSHDMNVERGPALNAVVMIAEDACQQADALDEEFERTGNLRPLHGIPVLVKDTIDVFKLPTAMGTLALKDSYPPDDAFIIARLRDAGAVIIGKATMDELSRGSSGKSSRSGFTRNSYDSTKNSGGSSAGSAVGVSANFSVLAIGADSQCSIRSPASYNGIVGLRPTPGLVSRDGTSDGYQIENVYGPMARTVTDLARLLDVIAVPDPADPLTLEPLLRRPTSYTSFLDSNGLKGMRIGILRHFGTIHAWGDPKSALITDLTRTAQGAILEDIAKLGGEIVDQISFPDFEFLRAQDASNQAVDNYLSSFSAPYKSYFDVISSGRVLPQNEMNENSRLMHFISWIHQSSSLSVNDKRLAIDIATKSFVLSVFNISPSDEERIWQIVAKDPYLNSIHIGSEIATKHKEKMRSALEQIMTSNRLNAIAYPESPFGPAYAWSEAKNETVAAQNARLSTVTEMPAIVVPGGWGSVAEPFATPQETPRPFGIEFMARKYDEATLIRIAYAFEQGTNHRKPPRYSFTTSTHNGSVNIPGFNALKLEAAEIFFSICSSIDEQDNDTQLNYFTNIVKQIFPR
ncbi:amidase family protein [Sphingomonas sp. LB2R24]|uniref:amidase family protein n=1 Tax=Sphingomonas sorbitolis TaxID=3096165 RepID=UPI002FCC8BAF